MKMHHRARASQILIMGFAAGVVAGCGSDPTASSPTCDDYAMQPVFAAGIGDGNRAGVIMEVLDAHGLPQTDFQLIRKVDESVVEFCGKSSIEGGTPASRNNSEPIENAVDWDQLKADYNGQ